LGGTINEQLALGTAAATAAAAAAGAAAWAIAFLAALPFSFGAGIPPLGFIGIWLFAGIWFVPA
jgi:hypothetical protein